MDIKNQAKKEDVSNINSCIGCSKDLVKEKPDKSDKLIKKKKQQCIYKAKRTKINEPKRYY